MAEEVKLSCVMQRNKPMTATPNHALQRTVAGHRGGNRRASWLPTIGIQRDLAAAGALLSYGPNLRAMSQRAAVFVDKILRGATPAELPVEQPTKYELVLNLKTAKTLGITMPPSLLLLADEVIQ